MIYSSFFTDTIQLTPPPPAPVPHRQITISSPLKQELDLHSSLMDNRNSCKKSSSLSVAEVSQTPTLYSTSRNEKADSPTLQLSPVWIPR